MCDMGALATDINSIGLLGVASGSKVVTKSVLQLIIHKQKLAQLARVKYHVMLK